MRRLLFEKYDSIRAVWHYHSRTFYSRIGTGLDVPDALKTAMPNLEIHVDGEFWYEINAYIHKKERGRWDGEDAV